MFLYKKGDLIYGEAEIKDTESEAFGKIDKYHYFYLSVTTGNRDHMKTVGL